MKKTSKIAALFMAAALTVALATGCSQQQNEQSSGSNQSASSAAVDSLTIAISADENTLTPFTYVHGSPGFDAMSLIYDTLFVRTPDNTIIPWMVKEYSVENDSKVYHITLEDGLKWHDGQPLTAEDVKFTFEYVLTQSRTRFSAIGKKVENIEVKNDKEFTITLKETDVNFINNSLTDLRIIPKHIYENEADATAVTSSVGSGIYKLVEYKSGEYYKLEAMEDYFKGSPKVKNLNLPIMTDKSSIQQGIISGQLAGSTTSVSAAVLDTFNNASGIDILKADGYAPTMLYFNCEREPFNNAKFRQAISLGIDMDTIIKGLENATGVVGRVEVVPTNTDYTVIIDYAHTPDGLENIIKTVKDFAKGDVITLFGCGGDRDNTKRPIMGEIAGKLSDYSIITSDNPRTEDPVSIIEQIEVGMKRTDGKYKVIVDRREAIAYALDHAKKDDVIILAGKGQETYQIIGKEKHDFDERVVVYKHLNK